MSGQGANENEPRVRADCSRGARLRKPGSMGMALGEEGALLRLVGASGGRGEMRTGKALDSGVPREDEQRGDGEADDRDDKNEAESGEHVDAAACAPHAEDL
mmetsp:Transcript_12951/g.34894  ORF Transcript_12951/g.34894 Transcript_12951/m.34894 type:complete len:102 (-) Transcript_12951:987-1292(-)